MSSPLPDRCPSCGGGMAAAEARCDDCGVAVSGRFSPCPFCRLGEEDRRLFGLFLASRGNLKQVERATGLSYPTVRQRVDDLLDRLGYSKDSALDRLEILRRLKTGEITVDQAADLLRKG